MRMRMSILHSLNCLANRNQFSLDSGQRQGSMPFLLFLAQQGNPGRLGAPILRAHFICWLLPIILIRVDDVVRVASYEDSLYELIIVPIETRSMPGTRKMIPGKRDGIFPILPFSPCCILGLILAPCISHLTSVPTPRE